MSLLRFVNNFIQPLERPLKPENSLKINSAFNDAIVPLTGEISENEFKNLLTRALNGAIVNNDANSGLINELVKNINHTHSQELKDSMNILNTFVQKIPDFITYLRNSIKGLENLTKIHRVLDDILPKQISFPKQTPKLSLFNFFDRDKCPELVPVDMIGHHDGAGA
jgi:hypothetical protein